MNMDLEDTIFVNNRDMTTPEMYQVSDSRIRMKSLQAQKTENELSQNSQSTVQQSK